MTHCKTCGKVVDEEIPRDVLTNPEKYLLFVTDGEFSSRIDAERIPYSERIKKKGAQKIQAFVRKNTFSKNVQIFHIDNGYLF